MDLFEEHPRIPGAFSRKKGVGAQIQTRASSQPAPQYRVQILSTRDTRKLLAETWDNTRIATEQTLLDKVISIDPRAVDWFELKYSVLRKLVFRLVYSVFSAEPRNESFIALSYCCPDETWAPSSVCAERCENGIALSTHMGNALFAEPRPGEGIWIDMLSINQDDQNEKAVAIGAMDIVYRSARIIVVVLEDIELSQEAADIIHNFEKNGREGLTVDQLNILTEAYATIFSSRWFTRAWCDHEFLVSPRCLFLIGVQGPEDMNTTLRLEGVILSELGTTAVKHRSSLVKPTDSQAQIDNIFPDSNWSHMMQTTRKIDSDLLADLYQMPRARHNGSYMHTFSRVFLLKSRFVRDKISIVLNAMLSGLSWKEAPSDDIEECFRRLLFLALVCGDPTALATTGRAIGNSSWQIMPTGGDEIRPDSMFQITSIAISFAVVGSCLSMKFVEIGKVFTAVEPSSKSTELARWIVNNRRGLRGDSWDWIMQLDQYEDSTTPGLCDAMEHFYIEALACAFDNGKDWILETSSILEQPVPSSMQTFVLEPMVQGQLNRAASDAMSMPIESLALAAKGHLHPLLSFTEKLVVVGLGMGIQGKEDASFWTTRSARILKTEKLKGTVLITVPPVTEANLTLAIPSAISGEQFAWMSRVWMLQTADQGRYKCLGKTRLAGKHNIDLTESIVMEIA